MQQINHEVVAIIDRSGSMRGKEDDTIGGINSTIEVLKNDKEKNTNMKMSVKLFDHEEIMLFRSINLEDVRPIERRQFVPRGQTALLDAIGNSLTFFMEKKLLDPQSFDYCTIYIVTDGLENCSKFYTSEKIKSLIQSAESKYNIKIVYLAANQDAILEASKYGISGDQALSFNETSENTQCAYRGVGNMVKRHRTGEHFGFSQAERSNATQSH
jgi:uncharacterized protein YegL